MEKVSTTLTPNASDKITASIDARRIFLMQAAAGLALAVTGCVHPSLEESRSVPSDRMQRDTEDWQHTWDTASDAEKEALRPVIQAHNQAVREMNKGNTDAGVNLPEIKEVKIQ